MKFSLWSLVLGLWRLAFGLLRRNLLFQAYSLQPTAYSLILTLYSLVKKYIRGALSYSIFFLIATILITCSWKSRENVQPKPSPVTKPISQPVQETLQAEKPGKYVISEDDRSLLLKIARETVDKWVREGKMAEFQVGADRPILRAPGAAFVTLRENGRLRGCIGHTMAQEPLWMCVRDVAMAAATQDPRFNPVSPVELGEIHIEVSVLTPLERLPNADPLVMGRDGVVIKRGFRTGVFLPQVATETGWDKTTFLAELCSQKAGLPPDCWKDPATEIYKFEAIVFEEKKR